MPSETDAGTAGGVSRADPFALRALGRPPSKTRWLTVGAPRRRSRTEV
ncbi:hypothetical protein [Halorussus caseinilyticus]|uniref:Uncharacterized protein n=1 Tax=Halorussus caseinilyticus TaxID=3034025 RepID=A0ABD5WHB8_9EURY